MHEADESTKEFPNQWWRWPLVPIASIAGAALGSTLISVIEWLVSGGGFVTHSPFFIFGFPLITAGIYGFIFAWIACYVAPVGKVITGIVMATSLVIIMLLADLALWAGPNIPTRACIQETLATAAVVIGAVFALLQAHEDHN